MQPWRFGFLCTDKTVFAHQISASLHHSQILDKLNSQLFVMLWIYAIQRYCHVIFQANLVADVQIWFSYQALRHGILGALLSMTWSQLWPILAHTVANILAVLAACSKYHEKHSVYKYYQFILEILKYMLKNRIKANSLETQIFFHSLFSPHILIQIWKLLKSYSYMTQCHLWKFKPAL